MSIPFVFHADYVTPLPKEHRFPMLKFGKVYEHLIKDGIASIDQFHCPAIASPALLELAHDQKYVNSYLTGTIDPKVMRRIGFPWSAELVRRTRTAIGGTVLTAELALQFGVACNTAGGTHHAHADFGSGYCIFNDLAITARHVQQLHSIHRVLIVDLDVHQGDGTAAILAQDPSIFTFSMHCEKNFPYRKASSDLDVQEYARMLNITTPVLTTQGAVIGDPVNGRVLAETLMPLDAARQVAQWVDETQRITVFYFTSEEGEVAIYQNHEQHKDASIDNDFFDHVFGDHRVLYPNFTQLLAADQMRPPVKFISINDAEKEEDIVSDLKVRFAPQLYITRTHPQLVEGTAQGVDKGSGVLRLCELLDVAPQRVLAIGDSDNDIPMLEIVGFAVAMGNASAGVKAVADWIAPSIDDDGAAVALNKFVLGP